MKQPKLSKKYKWLSIFIGIILIFSMFLLYFNVKLNQSVSVEESGYRFVVESGETLNSVLDELHKESIIPNALFAKLYARMQNLNEVYSGEYIFDTSMNTKDVIRLLNQPPRMNEVVVQLTEGFWAKDMAQQLAIALDMNADDFLSAWHDQTYIETLMASYDFLTEEIFNDNVRVYLEGYLYPDTYYIPLNASVDEVTRQILDNTQHYYNEVKDLIDASPYTTHEVFIFSSLVMYEARGEYDQQMVAGVFENRMEIGMPLQASASVCYVLYDFDSWLECEAYDNQAIDNLYNTYVYPGLPVGPILNPNIDAIRNTLMYQQHDYFYFVADVYEGGDGTVYYSKTLNEHENKVNELRNR